MYDKDDLLEGDVELMLLEDEEQSLLMKLFKVVDNSCVLVSSSDDVKLEREFSGLSLLNHVFVLAYPIVLRFDEAKSLPEALDSRVTLQRNHLNVPSPAERE